MINNITTGLNVLKAVSSFFTSYIFTDTRILFISLYIKHFIYLKSKLLLSMCIIKKCNTHYLKIFYSLKYKPTQCFLSFFSVILHINKIYSYNNNILHIAQFILKLLTCQLSIFAKLHSNYNICVNGD